MRLEDSNTIRKDDKFMRVKRNEEVKAVEEVVETPVVEEKVEETPISTPEPKKRATKNTANGKYKVTVASLKVRKAAGTDSDTVAVIPSGEYHITEIAEGKGSKNGWGKLESGAGWISLDFATKM